VLEREPASRGDDCNQIKCREVAVDKGLTQNSEDGSLLEHFSTKKKLEDKKENEIYTYSEISRITKNFFSLDWVNEDVKYPKQTVNGIEMKSIRDLFSSNVYWHYINNQYFPINLFSSKFDSLIDETSKRLMDFIALHKDNDCFTNDLVKFVSANAKDKHLTVDQLINLSLTEKEVGTRKIKAIEGGITKHIQYLSYPNESDKFNRSNLLLSIDNVFAVQPIKDSIKATQILPMDEQNILKDSIYHNPADIEYLERREKALKRQNTFSLLKKHTHYIEGRATRHCTTFEIPEMEIPLQPRFLLYNHMNCQVCIGEHTDPSNKLLSCSVSFHY